MTVYHQDTVNLDKFFEILILYCPVIFFIALNDFYNLNIEIQ